MKADEVAPYAPALIRLLQGVLADDDSHWNLLLQHRPAIDEYFARMGLEVYVDEAEGYAFLRQPAGDDEHEQAPILPRLVRRDRLSYAVTLLLVLLREALLQFDAAEQQSERLVLELEQLRAFQRPFYPPRGDEVRLAKTLDATVARVAELGFLRRLSGDTERYEVRRIIKAKISADVLAEIKARLLRHAEHDA